jgi:hypothetical protein
MRFCLKSLKGLAEMMQVMSINYKNLFLLGAGWSGAVSVGVMVTKIPDTRGNKTDARANKANARANETDAT